MLRGLQSDLASGEREMISPQLFLFPQTDLRACPIRRFVLHPRIMIHAKLPRLALLILAALNPLAASAEIEADFSAPPPDDWQRFDPLAELGLPLANFEFADGVCRLSCQAPSFELFQLYGYAVAPRLGLFAPQVFTTCASSVDILEWQPTVNRDTDVSFLSVMTRLTDPAGAGTAGGYAFSLELLPNDTAEAVIYRIVGENPIGLFRTAPFPLDPARDYRLLLVSRGTTHTGRLFALDDPAMPLIHITASDATFASGRAGFTLISDRLNPVTATFDNFLAWDASPAAMAIRPGSAPQTIELLTDTRRSMASILEITSDLTIPAADWLTTTADSFRLEGDTLVEVFSSAPEHGPTWFFRRKAF